MPVSKLQHDLSNCFAQRGKWSGFDYDALFCHECDGYYPAAYLLVSHHRWIRFAVIQLDHPQAKTGASLAIEPLDIRSGGWPADDIRMFFSLGGKYNAYSFRNHLQRSGYGSGYLD